MITGTYLYTMLFGRLVGTDEFGNRYFHAPGKILHGQERRWVLYKGEHDPSRVPPEWHAWLHHMVDDPLAEAAANAKPWQAPHQPNPTGTTAAYRPAGHGLRGGRPAEAYEAWRPDGV